VTGRVSLSGSRRQKKKMANTLGKIYECTKCGSRVIVTKPGGGALKCCGAPMQQK